MKNRYKNEGQIMKKYYRKNPINILMFLLMIHTMFLGNIMAGNTYVSDNNTTIKQPRSPIIVDSKLKEKFKQIDNLFIQLDAGILSEIDFFRKLGEKKLSVKDLVEFKANIINNEAKNKKNYQNGIDVWNYKYRHLEQNLMEKRREVILDTWDGVASEYIKSHPDCDTIARMDIGGWVRESKEKMRFEGDIDFTVVMLDTSDSIEIRDIFDQKVNEKFNMDMVAIDALATAHRAATLSVYIGDYGANWAEIDAINRGKMHIITRNEDATLAYRDATPVEKSVLFAVLKNNVAVSKGEPDRLAEILYEKDMPEPKYDMEPGISLEFLRHITSDAFNSKLALHEKVIKMSKYLNRSVAEHNKILKSAGVKSVPIDTEISRYANDIIRFKQSDSLSPELILLRIMRRTGYLLNDDSWVLRSEKSLGQIQKRMSKVIIHNITEGIDAYQKVAKGKKSIEEQDKVLKQMLDVLEEEYRAFVDEGMEDQFPDKALNEMHELAKYFNENNIKISPAEQKKIKELLKKIADNPKAANTWMGILYQHALKVYGSTDKAIDFVNKGLDVLDDNSVQKIRSSMIGVNIDVNGKIVSISIGSINNYLNGTVLGTIGNSVPYKGINLALEGKAYYDAVMNADTWSHGFVNLGYELMSRRLPGYAATGAWVNDDYGRLAVELTYLVFPLTAVPEGLYGMAKGTAEWGVAKLDEWEYNTLVDTLYDSATFQKKGSKWYMTGVAYDCPNQKKTIKFTVKDQKKIEQKDNLYKLLTSCPHISSILYPKIHNHPVLKQLEEMLGNDAVSSRQYIGTGWPYLYLDLTLYGKKLHKIYLKKVDNVTLEYFKGVIEGLEKRKDWEAGTGYAKIIKLEKKLGCKKPLIEYTKDISIAGHINNIMGGDDLKEDIKKDAERFQEIIDTYAKLKGSNKKISKLKNKWKAEFLQEKKPYCSIASIKKIEKNTAKLVVDLNNAVKTSRIFIEKYVNAQPTFEELQPLTHAKLCVTYFTLRAADTETERRRINYFKCYSHYKELEKKYKDEAGRLKAKINIFPEKLKYCIGEKATLSVVYNMRRDDSEVSWEILNKQGKVEQKLKSGIKTVWKPKSDGIKLIRAHVKASYFAGGSSLKYEKKLEKNITVKPESECSRLRITLDASNIREISKDSQVTVRAKILSLAPGNPPVTRYFWFENGKKMPSSEAPTYILSGKDKANETVTVEAIARDKNGKLSEKASIKIHIKDETSKSLDVRIVSSERKNIHKGTIVIKDNETILLKAIVNPKPDSGKLKFRWSVNKKTVFGDDGYKAVFKGKGWTGKKVVIDVVAIDEKNREGTASFTINVKSSQGIDVELEKHANVVTKRDHLKLRVKKPKQTSTKKYHYTWKRDGRIVIDKMEFDYFDITNFQNFIGKSVKFSVEVFDEANESIGETNTVIRVLSSKKEDEKNIQEKPTMLKITAPSTNQETPETTILVAGEVSNFENVVSMQMIVNAVKYQMKPSAKFSQKMPIVPGKNTLQVAAKLKDASVVHSQIVTVKSTQSAENHYRFTLRWNTARTDIDLWLVGPTGESCSYQNKNASFAKLDRDEKEAGYGPENIFIAQLTDYGKYKVRVQYYADHNKEDSEEEIPTTPTEAEVLFFVDNKLNKRWKGSLTSEKQWWDVYSFTYGMDIEINSPAKISVKIGETLNLTAKVKESSEGLGEMLKDKHVFRWVSDDGVEFSPVDTLKPKTTALFTRPGKVKIHVQVMVKKGDELKVVGESKDITIDVVGITYKLKVEPPKPMVGQEAVITVVPDYDIDKEALDIRWEVSGSLIRQGLMEAGNAWKYGVTSRESKPITVIARGRTPFYGDDAGEATITFTPQLYTVKAVKQGSAYGGMSVRVYDPRLRDFVEAPQGTIITDQTIRLSATIEGNPLPTDIRWKWTVNEGTSLSNEISKEPTVMRHESGSIVAKVEARNKEGVILGNGEISFSVFESDHGPKASQIKLKDAQEAWNAGDIDKAVTLIGEAQKINPGDTTISREFEQMRKDSTSIKSLLRDAKSLKNARKLNKAELRANDALKLNTKYKPAIKLHNEIIRLIKQQTAKANKLLQEARKLWKEGKLQQAIAKVAQAQKLVEKDKDITKTLKAMQMQKKDLDSKLREAEKLIKQGKLDAAKKVLDSAAMISAKYEKYKETLKQLADAKKKAEEKKKQLAKLLKDTKALKDAGKLHEAVIVLKKGSKQFPGNKEIDKLLKEVQKLQKDALEKMKEGQKQWKGGLLGEAVSILQEAAKIDPSNKQIVKVLKGMQGQKKIMDNVLKKTVLLIGQKKFKQAEDALVKSRYISKKYLPYIEMVKKLDLAKKKDKVLADALLKKAKDLWRTGKLGDAIATLTKGSNEFVTNKKISQSLRKMQQDKKKIDGTISKAENAIDQQKFIEAESLLVKARKISKNYLPYIEVMKRLNLEKEKVEKEKKQQSDAHKKLTKGQIQWKNGTLDKAVSTLEEAAKIDPSNRQISKVLKAKQGQKKMMDDALIKVGKLIEHKKFEEATKALKKVERISGKYPPYVEMVKKLDSAKKKVEETKKQLADILKNAKRLKNDGKLSEAVEILQKGSKQFHNNKKINKLLKDIQKQQAEEKPKTEKIDNIGGVVNGPKKPTTFKFNTKVKLLFLQTYHWNNGRGTASPGQIGLRHSDGTMYGPWQTKGKAGQGGVPNANWAVNPNIILKSGTYKVIDSDTKTWATNAQEGWKGFVIIRTGPVNYPDERSVSTLPNDADGDNISHISSLLGSWHFGRSKHYGKPVQEHLCDLTLTNELVKGIGYKINSCHPNESYWILEGNILLFIAKDRTITTKFTKVRPGYWEGTYVGSLHSGEDIVHYLKRSNGGVDTTEENAPDSTTGKNQITTPAPSLSGLSKVVAGSLQGLSWKMPCKESHKKVCSALVGKPVRSTVLGGDANTIYNVVLHFRGVVEQQSYTGGVKDQMWYIGGHPNNTGWNIYKLEIDDPHQVYYLNAGKTGIVHCFKIDYVKNIKMRGGSKIRLSADAQDGLLIWNRGNNGKPLMLSGIYDIAQPYNGQFIQMSVVSVKPASFTSEKKVSLKYIGCYKEKGYKAKVVPSMKNRVMHGYSFRGNMTVHKCSTVCSERGFKYAGLQYTDHCFCANTYNKYGIASNCNMPCSGNKNETCGGAWANSVYSLTGKGNLQDITQSDFIKIISATYGANCGTTSGNVTSHIAKQCNKKSKCQYTVDYKKIGDPAYGCKKIYTVQYRCGNNPQIFKESLSSEAGWGDKSVLLDCQQNNQPGAGKSIISASKVVVTKPERPALVNPSQNGKIEAKYIGCYKEKGYKAKVVPSMKNRVLNGYTFGGNMTVSKCTKVCSGKGFKYAAVQYANQCFCGNLYGKYGIADNCNMPCTGKKNEICGGRWANSVYKLTTKVVSDDEEKEAESKKVTLAQKIQRIRDAAEKASIEAIVPLEPSVAGKSQTTKNILVTRDENIYPDPSVRDYLADFNNYVIDGDESHAWVRLLFKDSALNSIQDKSLILKLTISKVKDAASRNGMVIYYKDAVVGRVGAVTHGQVVEASLDMSKIMISNSKLELILRAAGTDAPYIKSKASGQGAELKIVFAKKPRRL